MYALPLVDRIVVHAGSDGNRGADPLERYLSAERDLAFEWGARNGDCHLFVAGWLEIVRMPGAGAIWRGAYHTRDEAKRLLTEYGGPVWLGCDLLGPPRMGSEARRGDVGLAETREGLVGVICTGAMWAMRGARRGVRFVQIAPFITWDLRLS